LSQLPARLGASLACNGAGAAAEGALPGAERLGRSSRDAFSRMRCEVLVNWLLTMSSLPGNSILSGRSTWNFRCNIVSVSAHTSCGMLADAWRAKQNNTGFQQNAKSWRKCAHSLAPRALWITRIGGNVSQRSFDGRKRSSDELTRDRLPDPRRPATTRPVLLCEQFWTMTSSNGGQGGGTRKMGLAALLGYISNHVSCPGARFSADFGRYPGVALRRLGTARAGWGRGLRRNGPAPPRGSETCSAMERAQFLACNKPLFSEAISPGSEVCSLNISRPYADVADWSVHDSGCVKTPERAFFRKLKKVGHR
jgi:hypothetical protein